MIKRLSVLLICAILTVSCSKSGGDSAGTPSQKGSLPSSWYVLPENGGSTTLDETSPEADASVRTLFRAQTRALEASGPGPAALAALVAPGGAPSDWVPWHLDGMIASFAVSVDGLFGALLLDGTASIKGTWQRSQQPVSPPSSTPTKASAIHLDSRMTEADLAAKMEPVIRSAMASGKVRNEPALRENLHNRSRGFLAVCAALESMPRPKGWHVDSFQLQLTVGASGQVSPAIGVGGVLNVFFDWTMPQGTTPHPGGQVPPGLAQNVRDLSAIFQSALASLPEDRLRLRGSGLVLDMFQLGVAVGAAGDIGIARVAGVANGKIIFRADASHSEVAALKLPGESTGFVSLVGRESDAQPFAFAEANTVALDRRYDGTVAYQVGSGAFGRGLEKALRMAEYFARQARQADSKNWKITQVEAEFDTSVTGDLKIATVSGQGQVVLDFDRIDP
jgi:hypothetical protein